MKNVQYISYTIVFIIALFLKQHYSSASCNDLKWILTPTSYLVERASGIDFVYNENLGYVNEAFKVIIAKSCAGVNFFIILFCMFSFSIISKIRDSKQAIYTIIFSLISAYLLTLSVNGIRILISIWLYHTEISFGWLTKERIHRIEGIVVYFTFLSFFMHFYKTY